MNSDQPIFGGLVPSMGLTVRLFSLSAFLLISIGLQAQFCADFNEDDFNGATIKADENNPNPAPVTSNCIDIWNLSSGIAGQDGFGDVEITMTAGLFNPNADGSCNDGDFFVSGAIGGSDLPCPGPFSTSDFGGSTNNDCPCTSGYTCFTYTFKNGFDADASSLNVPFTSGNGSTEAHEALIGFVTQGSQTNGAPLTNLPTVDLNLLSTYCFAEYFAGVPVSTHVGATGPGTFAADDPTGNGVDCGDGIEEPDSGSGPNSSSSSQALSPNWGLNVGERISEFSICWILTNASGDDCDGDGETLVNSNPSGSVGSIEACGPAAPCIPIAPLFEFNLGCDGTYGIDLIIEDRLINGAAQVVTFFYSTCETCPLIPITGNEGLPTDGSDFWIHVQDTDDPTCDATFGPYESPTASIPSCGTFPANPTGN